MIDRIQRTLPIGWELVKTLLSLTQMPASLTLFLSDTGLGFLGFRLLYPHVVTYP